MPAYRCWRCSDDWMAKWAGAFSPFVREAEGAHFYDVDGHRYVDLCLGDTGANDRPLSFANSAGHGGASASRHHAHAAQRGCIFVGEELQARFGLQYWQFALTATDANRFSIRLARQITGRPKILVFNWCYHGTVDETFITLKGRRCSGPARQHRSSRGSNGHHTSG